MTFWPSLISRRAIHRWLTTTWRYGMVAVWIAPLFCAPPVGRCEEQIAQPPQGRLIDRSAFDRIVLTTEAGGETVEVQPLEFPQGRVPEPLPKEGSLSIYRISEPSVEYQVSWTSIQSIEPYGAIVLREAESLTSSGNLEEAFAFLAYLHKFYGETARLDAATQDYLWRDAASSFSAGKASDSLPILMALYDLNPAYPRLSNAVQIISDRQIARQLEEQNYAAARATLEMLEKSFPKLALSNIAKWRDQFATDAQREMEFARQAAASGDYVAARSSVRHAQAIFPSASGALELLGAMERASPELRVAVASVAPLPVESRLPTWERARIESLVAPTLVTLVDFGAEGGVYASRWGKLAHSDDGRQTTLRLEPAAIAQGLSPAVVSLMLLERADRTSAPFDVDFAAYLEAVEPVGGNSVVIAWKRPPISPGALLQASLTSIEKLFDLSQIVFQRQSSEDQSAREVRYQRRMANQNSRDAFDSAGAPEHQQGGRERPGPSSLVVVEQAMPDDDAALQALVRGDVDLLEKVMPWQLAQARQTPDVTVAAYRLPTLHALFLRPGVPLFEVREFRRALCYGIDRKQIVDDILLGGRSEPGFQAISGPFLAGTVAGDPVGYAYNAQLPPRPYQPRLAVVLAGVARETLARTTRSKPATKRSMPDADSDEAQASGADAMKDEAPLLPVQPLRLLHSADPLARLACQTIQLQLHGVGIPIELVEFSPSGLPSAIDYDLAYVELAIWDPIVAARNLLGPGGATGRSTAFMNLALDELSHSQNWNQARQLLSEIHRIARADLPLIPLWQTPNHFAHRNSLTGIGREPVTLYQNIDAWQKNFTVKNR